MYTKLSSATTACTVRGASSSKMAIKTSDTAKSVLTDDGPSELSKVVTSQFELIPNKKRKIKR